MNASASSPASDASLHVSPSTNMPPTIVPNTETGQSLHDAPTVLFGDGTNAQIGDELLRAGHDFVPSRRHRGI